MGLKQPCKILRKIRGKPLFLLKRFPTVEQWGMTTDNGKNKDYWEYTFPLAMGRAFIAALTRASGAYGYIAKVTGLTGTYLRWTDTDSSNQHGSGDIMYCIIIGTL